MLRRAVKSVVLLLLLAALLPSWSLAQSINASIAGAVTDPSGAVVPGAELTLTSTDLGTVAKVTTGADGYYSFPNLSPGKYELRVAAKGFRDYHQQGITLLSTQQARIDLSLTVGTATQTVSVTSNVSLLNTENAQIQGGIPPETITQLPLMVATRPRTAASFVLLMPGVSTGNQAQGRDVSINGGIQNIEEATLDGVSMQEGAQGPSGMLALWNDFPISPDKLSEIQVLTTNYEPQYGNTSSGQIIATTRSGTDAFHGSVYEYLRNTVLNANTWGATGKRPQDLENSFGASIGGPFRIGSHGVPLFWSGRKKTYFFVNYEGYRTRGGAITPVISIPSMQERQGDFRDWTKADGSLIPVYDPATTVIGANGVVARQQFMGCDGNTPNVICPSDPRLVNSIANGWIKYLPQPTKSGPLNNYSPPFAVPLDRVGDQNSWTIRGDQYWRDKDHFFVTVNRAVTIGKSICLLPTQICEVNLPANNGSGRERVGWDHTFTPTLLNHWAFGYGNDRSWGYNPGAAFADQLPKVAGVFSQLQPPVLTFSNGFNGIGANGLPQSIAASEGKYNRFEYITNDLLTWVHGSHTLKMGGEFRAPMINSHNVSNWGGTFNFSSASTGLAGITSGSPIASWLLGEVGSANAFFPTVTALYARQRAYALHIGDTWRVTRKLTINYGVRWDKWTPPWEKRNNNAFFDIKGANPDAGGLPGRVAWAGSSYGSASYGARYPETSWNGGFGPRIGIAYQFSQRTVVRTGYGLFFLGAFYPGDGAGMNQDGFNSTPSFSSTNGGVVAAFNLADGFPQSFPHPPFIESGFDNGQGGPYVRTFGPSRLPYSQQWNFTIEHETTQNLYITLAYVGNKGTHLPSVNDAINSLNPSLLSLGSDLNKQFGPNDTTIDTAMGPVSIPYVGWQRQMKACAPSVAQALLPFPQYCGGLHAVNEYAGSSTYHAFQAKVDKRLSSGLWALVSYTASKKISDIYSIWAFGPESGAISPYQRQRRKALAADDVPQILSAAFIYELPVGAGKHWINHGGVANKLIGGWSVNGIFRASAGTPMFFRSGQCNVPGQFRAACLPALLPGVNPFLQSKSSFDPAKGPLLNVAAFQPASTFNFNVGNGQVISNLRNFGYHNTDLALQKDTRLSERATFKFRAEFFNAFNWHTFTNNALPWTLSSFTNDIASPSFGKWNGSVSQPRVVQFSARVEF